VSFISRHLQRIMFQIFETDNSTGRLNGCTWNGPWNKSNCLVNLSWREMKMENSLLFKMSRIFFIFNVMRVMMCVGVLGPSRQNQGINGRFWKMSLAVWVLCAREANEKLWLYVGVSFIYDGKLRAFENLEITLLLWHLWRRLLQTKQTILLFT
jgi:hypothetical protein